MFSLEEALHSSKPLSADDIAANMNKVGQDMYGKTYFDNLLKGSEGFVFSGNMFGEYKNYTEKKSDVEGTITGRTWKYNTITDKTMTDTNITSRNLFLYKGHVVQLQSNLPTDARRLSVVNASDSFSSRWQNHSESRVYTIIVTVGEESVCFSYDMLSDKFSYAIMKDAETFRQKEKKIEVAKAKILEAKHTKIRAKYGKLKDATYLKANKLYELEQIELAKVKV